jgi:hypothetical protein
MESSSPQSSSTCARSIAFSRRNSFSSFPRPSACFSGHPRRGVAPRGPRTQLPRAAVSSPASRRRATAATSSASKRCTPRASTVGNSSTPSKRRTLARLLFNRLATAVRVTPNPTPKQAGPSSHSHQATTPATHTVASMSHAVALCRRGISQAARCRVAQAVASASRKHHATGRALWGKRRATRGAGWARLNVIPPSSAPPWRRCRR